jgi:uncharacterized Zn finger protein (UPF0148 family)
MIIPKCPNCGSFEVVMSTGGYVFCRICGWDELDVEGEEQ